MAAETVAVVRQTITSTQCDPTSGNPLYIGVALIGSATSAAVWQIRKLSYDGSNNLVSIRFANGSPNADQKWDDRASLSYA